MGLFQKKPQFGTNIPFYSLGDNRTVLIVGLGNIGDQYNGTRHNVGFAAIDQFTTDNDFPAWIDKKDLQCHMTVSQIGQTRVVAIKPTTFMNLSGQAVYAAAHFYKIPIANIIVIHDDLDVNFGQIRTKIGGGSAGHNGIKSITQQIGEQYGRLRIGIGPKTPEQIDSADFVLAKFSLEQAAQMRNLTREVSAIISEYVYGGGQLVVENRDFIV